MVERVARAIADNTLGMAADYDYAAQAGILAMREPTLAMLDRGMGIVTRDEALDVWRAMIDEALRLK